VRFSFAIVLLFAFCFNSSAQDKVLIANFSIIDGDTIFISNMPKVDILEFKYKDEQNQYRILKRRVLKVYPYAILAKEKLNTIQNGLDSIPKRRHKKRYTKQMLKWVKEEYSDRLKNLSMKEGKILVKLIYRETNLTSYEIVKSYRGRFNAFFWQTMAKIWKNNLKTEYDPLNIKEDKLIEHILLQNQLTKE
tara:strand:- start:503 stop:1078 length:576 start_codon:yes stop_codon:yes gene_type:complete